MVVKNVGKFDNGTLVVTAEAGASFGWHELAVANPFAERLVNPATT